MARPALLSRIRILYVIMGTISILACGTQDAGNSLPDPYEGVDSAHGPVASMPGKFLMLPNAGVTACELNAAEHGFDEVVYLNTNGDTVKRPPFTFTTNSLKDLIRDADCPKGQLLVMVRYGLDASGNLTYGVAPVCAERTVNRPFEAPVDHYVPGAQKELVKWSGATGQTWKNVYGDKYTSTIHIRRDGVNIVPFDTLKDTRYVLFDSGRILDLLRQNPAGNMIELVSFGYTRESGDMYHGVTMVATYDADGRYDVTDRLIDDAAHKEYFAKRALDLGSPCPENCDNFTSEYRGTKVNGCP